MAYLIFHNEEQLGPFEIEEIKGYVESGELPETVFIWQEGMADWTPANSIIPFTKGSLSIVTPPAIPAPSTALGPVIDAQSVEIVTKAGKIEKTFEDTFRKLVADEQDPAAVRKILGKINDLLTKGETVDYVALFQIRRSA